MSEPLLIVDVQVGFINSFTHHIPQRIADLIDRDRYSPLLFTRFVNAPGGPYESFLDWHSCNSDRSYVTLGRGKVEIGLSGSFGNSSRKAIHESH